MPELTPREIDAWLGKGRGDQAVAVVLGGSPNALSIARTLGRRRVPVLLLAHQHGSAAWTRYAKVGLTPDPVENPDGWLEMLDGIGTRLATPGVLIPTSDAVVLLVARHADTVSRSFRFVVPPPAVTEAMVNKRAQYGLAQAAGLLCPDTHFPESVDELRGVAAAISYPCLLKPYEGHLARRQLGGKVVVCGSSEELVAGYQSHSRGRVRLMVQEIVPGDDRALFGYAAFWDAAGEEHTWITKQKFRQSPPHFGNGSLQVSVLVPEVAALARRFLQAINYRGLVGVEFKLDSRDGAFRLIEVNPRAILANQLFIDSGVDLAWIYFQYLANPERPPRPVLGFREGVRWMHEDLDLEAFLALRRAGQLTFGDWLRSLSATRSFALFAGDDPLPLVRSIGARLKHMVRRTVVSTRARAAAAGPRLGSGGHRQANAGQTPNRQP